MHYYVLFQNVPLYFFLNFSVVIMHAILYHVFVLSVLIVMYDTKSFLVDQPKVSDWWTGHFDLCASKDHAMFKLIDFLHIREQINYIYLLTSQGHNENVIERNKEKKPLNPEVTPFTPQENLSTTQTSSTETNHLHQTPSTQH